MICIIYFIADTHFGHSNIIDYENRPFKSTNAMDRAMISRWNDVVYKDDTVYHLGDFALCGTERYFDIFHHLKGNKILIKGNHDQQSDTKLLERMGFKEVYNKFILDKYLLTHRPNFDTDYINIHGHKHGLNYKGSRSDKSNSHICVSVELINYKPISLEEIKEMIR